MPLTVTVTGDPARTGISGQRANVLLDDPYGAKTLSNYLNPAAFAPKIQYFTHENTFSQIEPFFPGLKKEDLPAVWADLNAAGMVSGAAYAKGLRTVKTCVGSEWCRFGTQDSTAMGIALERATWGSWTPHKVKMAVSGCPRNCAEATVKDVGVVATEGGEWEVSVGGAAGAQLYVAGLLRQLAAAGALAARRPQPLAGVSPGSAVGRAGVAVDEMGELRRSEHGCPSCPVGVTS